MPRKQVTYSHGGGKRYQTFLDKLAKHQTEEVGNWNEYQLMGYMVTQLKEHLDQEFMVMLAYEGEAMHSHPQMRILRNIIIALHQPDKSDPYASKVELMPCKEEYLPTRVKAYIDWSIQRILKNKHRQVFSLNYLLRDKDIQAFLAQENRIDRSELLPKELKAILPPYLVTFGDLSLYAQSCKLDQTITNELEARGIDLCQIT